MPLDPEPIASVEPDPVWLSLGVIECLANTYCHYPDPVAVIDEFGRFLWGNHTPWGASMDQFLGLRMYDYFPGWTRDSVRDAVRQAHEDKGLTKWEIENNHEGKDYWMFVEMWPIRGSMNTFVQAKSFTPEHGERAPAPVLANEIPDGLGSVEGILPLDTAAMTQALDAIRDVVAVQTSKLQSMIDPEVGRQLDGDGSGGALVDMDVFFGSPRLANLTKAERVAFRALLVHGNVEVASSAIGITVATMRNHVARIYKKLGVKSQLELLSYLFRDGNVH